VITLPQDRLHERLPHPDHRRLRGIPARGRRAPFRPPPTRTAWNPHAPATELPGVNWFTGCGDVMALDRGTLAKTDQKVFAELSHGSGSQTVRVPVSDATWSTWRRYCDALGLSMGEGVAVLVSHELEAVVNADTRDVLAEQAARRAAERGAQLDARERGLDERESRLQAKEAHVLALQRRIQQPPAAVSAAAPRAVAKVGRNDRCPCGSGFKYKLCHGI
jgi:SEC-C motif